MNILSSITDIALRRLFKFILKQVLGPYLESDLLLEQLERVEINSRVGHLVLNDLSINCDYINSILQSSPFRVKYLKVKRLEATISYTILVDGCTFILGGIEMAIITTSKISGNIMKFESESKCEESTSSIEGNMSSSIPEGKSLDNESLHFLASWVDAILSNMSFNVEDINIKLFFDDMLSPISDLEMKLMEFSFRNSLPITEKMSTGI